MTQADSVSSGVRFRSISQGTRFAGTAVIDGYAPGEVSLRAGFVHLTHRLLAVESILDFGQLDLPVRPLAPG